MYINCKTYFSYRYGTYSTEALVLAGVEAGATVMALTNINNTSDAWDFVSFCHEQGIKPVLGAEIRNGDTRCYILLARNTQGFTWINRFLSRHLVAKQAFPDRPDATEDVYVVYPFSTGIPQPLADNEYIGIQHTELNKLYGVDMKQMGHRLVVQHPVTFADKRSYNLHRLLRAIDKNIILSKQADGQIAGTHETFMSMAEVMAKYSRYPQLLTNTFHLLEGCGINMDFHTDKNKKYYTASKEDDRALLAKLASDGLHYRYGMKNRVASERVEKELKIINELNFNAYFLITWDLLKYAKNRGFYHVGRGSGANSIVAYCMQITDVDPIELDLYFERFLNPRRTSPPDFDIDFSWADRDEVIDYVFKRYGRDHVALLGMYSTFQSNASIRELGKVFGLPKQEIDALTEGLWSRTDRNHQQVMRYAEMMQDFPNHLSIHPGGMLISELPIYTYTAIDLPPKGFHTSQIDMFVAEKVGLFKFDILSQRGLGHIKDTITLVRQTRNIDIDIHDVDKFKRDEKVAANIRAGDTIGCFYIESPAMRQLLKKLRCDDYLTLVAASSIIRPGVGQSGMMHEYIYRFHNPDKFEYLHPRMKELLQETYGVMVYQEDVIKVAHHFGGLDMGEADILRRAMSGKYRGNKEMQRLEKQFFANCEARGYPEAISREVWRQIASFAGYSFSKAHSASFAVESYQSLYLKTHFPIEFMVAVINNFGGFYSREIYFHQLKRMGAAVEAPCINHSDYLTGIRDGRVYVGFIHIKSLEEKTASQLLEERHRNGPYLHLQDFIERTCVTMEALNTLIKVGGLRFTGRTKKELLWEGNFLRRSNEKHVPARSSLFEEKPLTFNLPQLPQSPLEDIVQEMEILGFPLGDVFDLVDTDLGIYPVATGLSGMVGGEVTCLGYLVTIKYARTKNDGRTMYFGTWLDHSGDWLDTVHFPDSAAKYPPQKRGFYRFRGKVISEFGVVTVSVEWMEKVGIKKTRV